MDADLDTLATALYVRVDDLLKISPDRAPARPLVGIAPRISDAELLTLAVMQALLGFTSEARWLRHARGRFAVLFPYLPLQPGYNKRVRALAGTMNWLIGVLARDTRVWTDDVWVVDSTPVECGRSRETPGMRVLIRAERPHPGAQLRFTDVDGNRLTSFVTNTGTGQLADLELRHRRRARCEDRIRTAKDTGMRNLPLTDFAQNRIWIAVVQLATELTAWRQMQALAGTQARRWEPKRLQLRLFSVAGTIARRSRRVHRHLSGHAPHRRLFTTGLAQLQALPAPT